MTAGDDAPPALPLPESGMATGSDSGEPGEHLAEPPLQPDEERLLDSMRHPGPPVVDPVEDSVDVVAAVDDDAPIEELSPPGGTGAADPLTPQFRSPE